MANRESCGDLVRRTGQPDAACLESAAVHVAHDLYLLKHAWDARGLRVGWTLWFVTARALMDFFFVYERTKKRGDDILAADFLPKGTWQPTAERFAAEQPPEYAACRLVANKLSAHLTYSRVHLTAEGSTPPSQAVHDYLLGVAGMWLDALSPERRAWFAAWFPIRASEADGRPKEQGIGD